MRYQAPRGTQDILPTEQHFWRYVMEKAEAISWKFGYARIDTPLFEQAGLFLRTVGQGTDIVEKETYTFRDRGDEELTLRAEGTAPVCRAYLESGMHTWTQPVRLSYFCPVFRYERPQAGRFRQHHQFGVEAIGDSDPAVDAEVIELGWRFTRDLGLSGLVLLINSIGCPDCRPAYLESLRAFYKPHIETKHVCPDCQVRFQRNLLRVLDCKRSDFSCQELVAEAPACINYLCGPCSSHWDATQSHLKNLDVPFHVKHSLVRGFDYYTRTTFEIQPEDSNGAQNTVLAGGRYDGLIEELGGRPTPGIGFGSGLERLIVNLKRQSIQVPASLAMEVVLVSQSESMRGQALRLAGRLREEGIRAVLASNRSLRGQMRQATALGARYTLILGDDELAKAVVQVRDMNTGQQQEVSISTVAFHLANNLT